MMIHLKKCKKCGCLFDIESCPKCSGYVEPEKVDITKFDEVGA